MKLTKKNAESDLLQMYQIRAFEEQAEKSYMAGKIHGTMHLSIGQEASAVGSISTLEPTDFIIGHHRGHGLCIAKGADLNLMMAEFYGKENGYCRGREAPCISPMWLEVIWAPMVLSGEVFLWLLVWELA